MKNFNRLLLLLVFATGVFSVSGQSPERPNILLLTFEDSSPALGCYGNTMVRTPVLDSLASEGIRYTRAYSNGAQCSPARSTMIFGKYAIALGTDIHREARPVPDGLYYPLFLRKAGYYCYGTGKQDYNARRVPKDLWEKTFYAKRPDKSKPFFAVFNYGVTHMTRVATLTTDNRSPRTVDPAKVRVPAYIPDLPEVRDDIAWHDDAMNLLDHWVAQRLEELRKSGEADNTIVIISADHGGCIPRGKGYIYESGTRIPLIVHMPEKWKHLANAPLPQVSDRFVSFVDFAPTFLNLAGVAQPEHMTGKPFLGKDANDKKNIRKHVLLFKANQGVSFSPSRAVTDGRMKLIWNFHPSFPDGTRQSYQWQMPAQMAWDKANIKGQLKPLEKEFWELTDPIQLFDIVEDPDEVNNLINRAEYRKDAKRLKKLLLSELKDIGDIGLFPRDLRYDFPNGSNLYETVHNSGRDLSKILDAAVLASYRDPQQINALKKLLLDKDPVVRYWGATGICGLARAGTLTAPAFLNQWWKEHAEEVAEVKIMMAEAMVYTQQGATAPLQYLLDRIKENSYAALGSVQNLGERAMPIADALMALEENKSTPNKFYLRSILINLGKMDYNQLYGKLHEHQEDE